MNAQNEVGHLGQNQLQGIATLVPTRSDADIAAAFKKEAETALIDLCGILDRANRAGFVIGFNIGVIPGRNVLQNLTVAKHY